jgi:hypothetical protein
MRRGEPVPLQVVGCRHEQATRLRQRVRHKMRGRKLTKADRQIHALLDQIHAANEFLTAFAPRVDRVDEINAIDAQVNGRAVLTFNLDWQHLKPFFGALQPTGRTGTSMENLIMTVRTGKVTRIEVSDTTLDLVIYMHERGWVFPQNIRPEPLVIGVERAPAAPTVRLQ